MPEASGGKEEGLALSTAWQPPLQNREMVSVSHRVCGAFMTVDRGHPESHLVRHRSPHGKEGEQVVPEKLRVRDLEAEWKP